MKNTYMDDHLDGGNDPETFSTHIENVIITIIEVYRRGGFFICNWSSNSTEVLNSIQPERRATGCVSLGESDERPVERVLGLYWNPNDDTFSFRISFEKVDPEVISGEKNPTKRDVLKPMMSLYDPLGFLAHLIVKAKIFFQIVWRSGVGWDDVIPLELVSIWQTWLNTLKKISSYKVPRCYHFHLFEAEIIQLHIFSDASEEAFASVAYLRIASGSEISTAFLLAKTKVAPLKPLSIPRLELQAAVIGTRLARTIKKELNVQIHSTHFWSDSRIVLCLIRSDARSFKQFVANRVGEILEESNAEQWRWVPTAENVADDATRSDPKCDLSTNGRWLIGPEFLRQPLEDWPTEPDSALNEVKEEKKRDLLLLHISIDIDQMCLLPDVIRFSNYQRLIRATAYVRKIGMIWAGNESTGTLNAGELLQAEYLWCRKVQKDSFETEMKRLQEGKVLEKQSRLFKFSAFLDECGLLRVKGRTSQAAGIDADAVHPIILDSRHAFTHLLVMDFHRKGLHVGREAVTNEIKQKFCVINLRALVKKVFSSCQDCKVKKAVPAPPEMGILPDVRVNVQVRAFIKTGVDFFGPMLVAVGRRREKRYGVLFTCLTVRAVHLELAEDLTTSSTLNALRRFIGRRGVPDDIHSDNGTNFKSASRELRESVEQLDKGTIVEFATRKGINWHFNPPASPHMGECWERLVRSAKVALEASLHERVPREDVLRALLVEAEALINSRPLTFVSVDPDDPESLTPNHFLLGKNNLVSAPGIFTDDDTRLRNQWRYAQRLADHFWSRWVKEFLPTLTRRTKWFGHVEPIKVDDVVVIADPNAARGTWPLAIVIRVFPDKFGRVRFADVRTKDGVYRRPATKLCVLDVRKTDKE